MDNSLTNSANDPFSPHGKGGNRKLPEHGMRPPSHDGPLFTMEGPKRIMQRQAAASSRKRVENLAYNLLESDLRHA
jgi:hypothetical protein